MLANGLLEHRIVFDDDFPKVRNALDILKVVDVGRFVLWLRFLLSVLSRFDDASNDCLDFGFLGVVKRQKLIEVGNLAFRNLGAFGDNWGASKLHLGLKSFEFLFKLIVDAAAFIREHVQHLESRLNLFGHL